MHEAGWSITVTNAARSSILEHSTIACLVRSELNNSLGWWWSSLLVFTFGLLIFLLLEFQSWVDCIARAIKRRANKIGANGIQRGRILVARAVSKMRYSETKNNKIEPRNNEIREQYADFLHRYNFDYFFTATFKTGQFKNSYWERPGLVYKPEQPLHTWYEERKPRKEPYYAMKAVIDELRAYKVERGFVVAEPHQSGDLHTHGIIAGGLPGQQSIALPWEIWSGLFDKFGRAKVEAPNKSECVTMYCAKYLLKQQHRVCDYYTLFGDKVYWRAGKIDKTALERAAIRAGAEYI